MKETYLFLAKGFEEVEALTAVDVLRRADIPVKTVSITDSLQVEGAHGIPVTADCLFADTNFDDAEWLILPGGMPGSVNLHEFAPLQQLLLRRLPHAAAPYDADIRDVLLPPRSRHSHETSGKSSCIFLLCSIS